MDQSAVFDDSEHIIFGLGDTGLSTARYLYSKGKRFCVYDNFKNPPALKILKQEMPDIKFYSGERQLFTINPGTKILLSPGVPRSDSFLREAIEAGATIKSDLDLFITEVDVPIIGITGSNGKSTVTELLGAMASESGYKVAIGGNLGPPALDLLDTKAEIFILELSSFQLENSDALNLSIATILNLSPDHLDRHRTMHGYSLAKQRIFLGCKTAVINLDDKTTYPNNFDGRLIIKWSFDEPKSGEIGLAGEFPNIFICFGTKIIMRADEIYLPGKHNLANSLAALTIGISIGFSIESMCGVLKNFSGLAHRCELILSKEGVNWINDSKATNVGATRAALEGLGERKNIILIAGGIAKGANFQSLLTPIKKHCKKVILIGESALKFSSIISDDVQVSLVTSIEEAVKLSKSYSSIGDLVLLSPACSSLDMFRDYIDRGETFIKAVLDIVGVQK